AKYGRPPEREARSVFQSLVRSIIYQQVTGKAAAAIMARFVALYPGEEFPSPLTVRDTSIETLRSAGLSGQKAAYIKDLAEKCTDGTIDERLLPAMSNDEVVEHLVRVKGIGEWTAHMFLITTLERLDVLPVGDLGIQKGFKALYKLRKLPTPKKMEQLAKPWRPFASVASWYLWRVADDAKLKV
ncbi:MAG: DNA-3-methyladenine glycosylase, partial [Patescibacteria group bacterium]|nr:DNA-3-methyladenine glycosylase [Patescibacteria group bacterium]